MNKILALVLFAAAACFARAAEPVITIDLYGNVFKEGQNTNQQIGDFARNNPTLAPLVDGAVRQAVLDARAKIAADTKAAQDAADARAKAAEAASAKAIADNRDALTYAGERVATLETRLAALEPKAATLQAQLETSAAYIAKLQKALRDAGLTVPTP